MLAEKGYLDGEVTHTIKPIAGGPKLVNLTFNIEEGPQVQIQDIDFVGNEAIERRRAQAPDEEEQGADVHQPLPQQRHLPAGQVRGRRREASVELYRDRGLHRRARRPARGQDARGRRTTARRASCSCASRSPRAAATASASSPSTATRSSSPRACGRSSSSKKGEYYSEKNIRKGLEKAREVYGTGGYFEFTGFPDLKPRDMVDPSKPDQFLPEGAEPNGPPVVDVTMRMQEGKQYFVNRITFMGNTTTRDNVIRREMRPVRERRLQHRGAEVQRQAPQPARVLQEARGRATPSTSTRRPARRTRSTSR